MNTWFRRPFAKYAATMLVSLTFYSVVLALSLNWLRAGIEGYWKYVVAVLPVLPAMGVPVAVVGYCKKLDELQLRIQFESLAFGFASTAVATITYGFLQNVGLPDVSWVWVWPVMAVCWMLGQLLARWRYC